MIIPGIGHIGKKTAYGEITGQSNSAGFILNIKSNKGSKLHFQTRNYVSAPRTSLKRIIWKIFEMVALFFVAIIASRKIIGLPTDATIYFLFAILLMITLIDFRIRNRDTAEWHVCEHKTKVMLDAGLEPTIANIKRCPKALVLCGTAMLIEAMQVVLPSVLYSLQEKMFQIPLPLFYISIILAVSTCFLAIMIFCTRFNTAVLILLPLSFPAMILPLLLENFFALKNPPEEKLRQTVEDLQNFLKNLENPKTEEKTNA